MTTSAEGGFDLGPERLYLTPQAFIARVQSSLIILNVVSDEYLLVSATDAEQLAHELGLKGRSVGRIVLDAERERYVELRDALLASGTVTYSSSQGKSATALEMLSTSMEIPGCDPDRLPSIRLGHVLQVMASTVGAFLLLRLLPFHTMISWVGRLKNRHSERRSPDVSTCDLVEIYLRLRPFFFSARDRCMLDSLAMLLFLHRHGIRPLWTFGVRLKPFAAHCWLEDSTFLYNDQFYRTFRYVPIMRF